MGHELRVFLQIHPGQLTTRNSTLPQNCFSPVFRVGMLAGGGRERGGVEVQLWVAITLLGCAISPFWNRWEGAGLGPFTSACSGYCFGFFFFLLLSLFKVLVKQPWRDTEPVSQGLSVFGHKTRHKQSRKRKEKLNSFSGSGIQN